MCRSAFLSCDSLFHLRRLLWALKLFLMSHFGSLVLRLLTTFFPRLDENRQLTRRCHSGSSFTQPDEFFWEVSDPTGTHECEGRTGGTWPASDVADGPPPRWWGPTEPSVSLDVWCSDKCLILSKKSIKYLRSYFNRNNLKLRRTNFTGFGFHQVYTATQTLLLDSHGSVSRWSLTIKGSSFLLTFVLGFNKTLGKSRRTLRFCFHSEDSGGKREAPPTKTAVDMNIDLRLKEANSNLTLKVLTVVAESNELDCTIGENQWTAAEVTTKIKLIWLYQKPW